MPQKRASLYLYLSGIAIMLLGLPTSRFLMSISQFILLGAWLSYGIERVLEEGKHPGITWPLVLIGKLFSGLWRQKEALIFLSIIGIHIIGMLWTQDYAYGVRDLRIKLPMLLLPVVFSTMPALSKKQLNSLMGVYLFALFAASAEGMYILFTKDITDIREISPHISHVRLALNIVLGVFITIYLTLSRKSGLKNIYRIVALILGVWLFLFLLIMKSPTGLLIFAITAGIVFLMYVFSLQNRVLRTVIPVFLGLMVMVAGYSLYTMIHEYTSVESFRIEDLDTKTARGNTYTHDTIHFPGVENGSYIGLYICPEELEEAWAGRSGMDFQGHDHKDQELKVTLIRYLNSRGLRKDADGIAALSDADIRAIEGGVANHYYISKFSVRGRIYQMLLGMDLFRRTGNPNGNSMLQRREYWKAGWNIFMAHPVFGVGTGDLKKSFKQYYIETNSRLLPEYRHRAHNQYLSIAIALGVMGLLVFFAGFFYPPYKLKRHRVWYFTVILSIVVLSFIAEDTLETQAGSTFSAFFYSLFLWGTLSPKGEKPKIQSDENI